jgi:hypothetical protein
MLQVRGFVGKLKFTNRPVGGKLSLIVETEEQARLTQVTYITDSNDIFINTNYHYGTPNGKIETDRQLKNRVEILVDSVAAKRVSPRLVSYLHYGIPWLPQFGHSTNSTFLW